MRAQSPDRFARNAANGAVVLAIVPMLGVGVEVLAEPVAHRLVLAVALGWVALHSMDLTYRRDQLVNSTLRRMIGLGPLATRGFSVDSNQTVSRCRLPLCYAASSRPLSHPISYPMAKIKSEHRHSTWRSPKIEYGSH